MVPCVHVIVDSALQKSAYMFPTALTLAKGSIIVPTCKLLFLIVVGYLILHSYFSFLYILLLA